MTPAKKRHSFRKMNFAYAFEHAYVSPIHATMARQFHEGHEPGAGEVRSR
jgi:hypothetical protein